VAVFIRCEEREPSYAEAVGKARGQISFGRIEYRGHQTEIGPS